MSTVQWLLAGGIALAMLYTGLLVNPAWLTRGFLRGKLRPFASMAALNYLAVPVFALGMTWLLPIDPTLALTLLTLAALPCAPLVPALVTMAGEAPDWPLFVFLGFSLVSLLVVIALIAALANATPYAANIGTDTASKLLQYFLLVYGPMTVGALFRFLAPSAGERLIRPVRALTGIGMLLILGVFATAHRDEFANVSAGDLVMLFGFVLGCVALGALLKPGADRPRLTAIISTCFRNVALAIAFATVVLRRPDVTAYMVVYSALTLFVCGAVLGLCKLTAARRAAPG